MTTVDTLVDVESLTVMQQGYLFQVLGLASLFRALRNFRKLPISASVFRDMCNQIARFLYKQLIDRMQVSSITVGAADYGADFSTCLTIRAIYY